MNLPPRQSAPGLTVTETGCHVWVGWAYGPCHAHGTVGCCLIAHGTPAAQRAFDLPRCDVCQRWMSKDRTYEEFCPACEIERSFR